jgi:uncharacterized membrane protein YeiH
MGSAIIYIFPPLMFLSLLRRDKQAGVAMTGKLRAEKAFNIGMVVLGVFAALAGGTVSVLDSFLPHLLA